MKASPASTKPSAWRGLILFLCSPALAPADTLTAAMTAVTARVLCLPSDGDPHTGSGFILGDGTHLVTNWHVVACTREGGQALVLLDAAARETVAATVREHDEAKDLAVLRLARTIARPATRFATLATLAPRDPVVVVGFPGDADEMGGLAALSTATLTEGVVGRLLPAAGPAGVPLVQVSAAINPGSSGGPLFDEAGRVVGVITLKSLAAVAALGPAGELAVQRVVLGEGLGWAVASDALLPLLDRAGIPSEASHSRLWALERWWWREPLLMATLGLLALVAVGLSVLLVTLPGRAQVRAGLTRRRAPLPAAAGPRSPAAAMPSASRQPVLRGVAGPYAGQTIPLSRGPVAIGRDPALVQLVLPGDQAAISQRHALVGHDPVTGGFFVEDCWSTHGVFLRAGPQGGVRLKAGQAQPLPAGAVFYLATPAVSFEVTYQ